MGKFKVYTLSTFNTSKDMAILAFKKIPGTPTKNWLKLSPVSERSAYPLQNYILLFPAHLWVREFGHKSTPSDRPWIKAYCPKF